MRYAFNLRGVILTNGVIAPNSPLSDVEVESNLANSMSIMDIDNDGSIGALSDGLLLLRYLYGMRGYDLIRDVVSQDATRTSAEEITVYIDSLMP